VPSNDPEPTDAESWKNLVGKLREEIKAVKADRTPQDEKDAKVIASLRKQLESTPSPEDVKKEMAQAIGKALGLVKDEPIDPAKLTESLTTSQAEAKQARVELAVFRSAASAGGDPAALLDSSSFLASLAAVDPADSAAVTAAIQAAVAANPRLGAAPAGPKPPAPNPAQGGSASGSPAVGQLTRQQVEQMSRDGKHAEIEKARQEGRLNDLLGIKS
jgi:hypothetical protein